MSHRGTPEDSQKICSQLSYYIGAGLREDSRGGHQKEILEASQEFERESQSPHKEPRWILTGLTEDSEDTYHTV